MRIRPTSSVIGVLLCFGAAAGASAQTGAIAGTITEAVTGQPVDGAAIEVRGGAASAPVSAFSDEGGRFLTSGLVPGRYSLTVASFSHRPYQSSVTVRAGETVEVDVQLGLRIIAAGGITVSAARKPEDVLGTAAMVAVVDSQALSERPTVSLVDHLRGVPAVDQISYGLQSSNVVTRGFNNLFSGALHTLTDYRIASVPSLRVNLLHLEPTTNQDLERMEVVLGPGAALYGPNTANGVLHIVTRSPLEHQGTDVAVGVGERSLMQQSFRTAHLLGEDVGVKLSGQHVQGREWEFLDPVEEAARRAVESDPAACRAGWMSGGVDSEEASVRCARTGHRGFDLQRWSMDGRVDWQAGRSLTAVASAGLARAVNGIELTGIGAAQARDWTKYYGQLRMRAGRLFGQLYLNGSDAGETYLLQNGASISDRSKLLVAQVQHGLALGEVQELTYGVDFLRTIPETDGTINGRHESDDVLTEVGAYLHSETGLGSRLSLILAGRVDRTSALDRAVFSPRAGLVFRPGRGHALRATVNSAFETPTSLNMFLDIHAGGVPDPALSALGYGMRAQGPGREGIDLVRDDGWLHGMRSPFNPAGAGQLLPAEASTLWALAVGVMQARGDIDAQTAADFMALDASALGLTALDPNTMAITSVADAGLTDVPRIAESRQTTLELGYKGLLGGNRLLLAADAWYTEKSDFVSPLLAQTPFLLIDGATTVQMLVPYYMGQGLSQEQATAQALGLVQGDENVVGDGIAEVPLAVASAPDVNAVGADMLVSYRNFGRVTLWGADLAATVLLGRNWSLGLTGSFVSDDHFAVPLQGTTQIVALNAPAVKTSASLGVRDPRGGFNAEARVRYHSSFPANSAGYSGLACAGVATSGACVEDATLADLTFGYRLPRMPGASLQLSVQNVFDTPYRSFVRVPTTGRLALLRLSYEF